MVLEHTFGALITSFASKYIDNLDLSALRLSVFGGDVVLRNLELKLEVLRREFAAGLPIEFQRGFVREIRIHIPWLKLASEPIELSIDTVELVASLLPPDTASGCPEPAVSSGASTEAAAELGGGSASTDGWMGPLLTKALFNMSVRLAHRARCSAHPSSQPRLHLTPRWSCATSCSSSSRSVRWPPSRSARSRSIPPARSGSAHASSPRGRAGGCARR